MELSTEFTALTGRQIRKLIVKNGYGFLNDPARVEAYLGEALPNRPQLVNALVAAAKARLHFELAKLPAADETVREELSIRLAADGIDPAYAASAITSWTIALGKPLHSAL